VLAALVVDIAAGGPLSTSLDPRVARHEAPVVAGLPTTLAQWLADAATWWLQGGVLLAVTAVVLVVRRRPCDAVPVVLGLVLLAVTVAGLKLAVGRLGPREWSPAAYGGSFPSGHAASAVVVGVLIARVLRPPGHRGTTVALGGALAWAVLVGWSRVHLDVHWTTDVLGGWAAGALVLAGTAALTRSDRSARQPCPRRARPGPPGRLRR
jgi:membrane-associated phospholipid phosphatase